MLLRRNNKLMQGNKQIISMASKKGYEVAALDPSNNAENVKFSFILSGGPFASSSVFIRSLHSLSCFSISLWLFVLDFLLSRFVSTTSSSQSAEIFVFFICKVVLSFALLLFFAPFALVSFLIWFPLQMLRPRPYSYYCLNNHSKILPNSHKNTPKFPLHPSKAASMCGDGGPIEATFFLTSANVCLMPEFAARINNLSHTVNRAKKIATYFSGKTEVFSPATFKWSRTRETSFLCPFSSNESMNFVGASKSPDDLGDAQSVASTLCSVTSKEQVVCDIFPDYVDFLCLQEVFDTRATRCLLDILTKKFPHIIYDVSWPVRRYRMTLLSSGLLIASRYPFIDVAFHPFPDGNRDDKLACKGLLMSKVYLGKTGEKKTLVGYLSNTHLQAWSRLAASDARCKQLSRIEEWLKKFIESSKKFDECEEIIVFNLISGDFNFDKLSYFDHNEQCCSLAKSFRDPCLDECGRQHSWVIGTELKQQKMHDENVCTPRGLQRMLISELERHRYVESTMPKKTSLPRAGDGKRKIDYILYKDCDSVNLSVKDFKFFTGLATLSDHLPIGMSFSCHVNS